jgi:hypothetical protein
VARVVKAVMNRFGVEEDLQVWLEIEGVAQIQVVQVRRLEAREAQRVGDAVLW